MDCASDFRFFFGRPMLTDPRQSISGVAGIFYRISPSGQRKVVGGDMLSGIRRQFPTIRFVLTLYFFFTWPPCLWCSSCSCFSWCILP